MKKHSVSVELQREGRVFVQPYTQTLEGASIADGLPTVIASIENAEALGAAVVHALGVSNRRPLPPRDLRVDPPGREFLEWLGLRSYVQYAKGVRTVSVRATYSDRIGEVVLTPERNEGRRGGFTPIVEDRSTLSFESPEQLGRAVQEAMGKATL